MLIDERLIYSISNDIHSYTMGILESVRNEHAGIIPRALAQLFEHVSASYNEAADIKVTLSFLQLYRETIQDLLAPAIAAPSIGTSEDNLLIREDPQKGFYVEGLQEFIVHDYSEAEALVNLGLENRAIAPTLMNATSSRSHTVLTLSLEQRGASIAPGMTPGSQSRLVRSKLLLVDLAGSERVRRTISKGTRLNEARSINTSLSALGNVIAALAEDRPQHIPYRDSKLTRLLQDSLGGTASTALVATVGPSAINYGETLSTLLFAARCMAVKTTPVQHEEVDYPDLCTRLQARVAQLERQMSERVLELQGKYESTIAQLRNQLESTGAGSGRALLRAPSPTVGQTIDTSGMSNLLKHLADVQRSISNGGQPKTWLGEAILDNEDNALLLPLLGYAFSLLRAISEDFARLLSDDAAREESQRIALIQSFAAEADREAARELEASHFAAHDPLLNDPEECLRFGGHLAALSRLEALTRVEGQHRRPSGQSPIGGMVAPDWEKLGIHDSLIEYDDPQEVVGALGRMHSLAVQNMKSAASLMYAKDSAFADVKSELVSQIVERRQREEEVVNWSCILKYLLSTSTKLRRQLKQEQQLREGKPSDNMNDRMVFASNALRSATGTPQSLCAPDFSRLEGSPSMRSTVISGDSPLHRVRERMARMSELEQLNGGYEQPGALHGRLSQTGKNEKHALAINRATVQAAQEDEADNVDQLSAAFGNVDANSAVSAASRQVGRAPSPIIRGSPRQGAIHSQSLSRARSASPKQRAQSPVSTPSGYAQSVVRNLGVQGAKASAAAQIVDKVMKLTASQLEAMDVETREQVLRVRRDLGLGAPSSGSATQVRTTNDKEKLKQKPRRDYYEDEEYSQI